jgi:malate synthase
MEEILYELRDHSAALNAGRWDYLFSIIKKFREHADLRQPDRSQLTMAVPFMRAYTQLLVKTCHARGAHAIGGMAAFIPNRKDPDVTERALAKVREDKLREAGDGFDGTWVAHPDLVPVALEIFDKTLGKKANQVDKLRPDVQANARDLLDFRVEGGKVTEEGVRLNVSVAILYLESWLRGTGAAAINNLMEDAATAEISRSQLWLWMHRREKLPDGRAVNQQLIAKVVEEELANIKTLVGDERFKAGRFADARKLLETVALGADFPEFLTIPAYEMIP